MEWSVSIFLLFFRYPVLLWSLEVLLGPTVSIIEIPGCFGPPPSGRGARTVCASQLKFYTRLHSCVVKEKRGLTQKPLIEIPRPTLAVKIASKIMSPYHFYRDYGLFFGI